MRHTLTAVFENRGDAQHALNKLLAAGFSRADAVLAPATATHDGDTRCTDEYDASPPVVHSSNRLPRARSGTLLASFSRKAASNPYIVTLTTESEPEVLCATALVGRFMGTDGDGNDDRRILGFIPMMRNQTSRGYQDRIRVWKLVLAHQNASWALRHVGELPPWERFKDALLHGWSRIKVGSGD